MPIQPLSLDGYEPIPETEEDVTPLDRLLTRRARKSWKFIIGGFVIGVVIIAVVIYVVVYLSNNKSNYNDIRVYLTGNGIHSMTELTIKDIQEFSPEITSLSFGNIATPNNANQVNQGQTASNNAPSLVIVDTTKKYQEILGFGGAFTESSAINFYKLPKRLQHEILDKYFSKNGIGLTLGRIHINSCDFSPNSYSFDEVENDFNLDFFDNEVTHDQMTIIPFILDAMEASSSEIKLVASPWSPPAWMKVNNNPTNSTTMTMTGSAYPNGLRNEHPVKLAWAQYLSKFITAYKAKNINIWAITPQNEPEFPAPWEACAYNAAFEGEFINEYLGPILRSQHPEVKLLAFDHNKDHLLTWAKELLPDGKNPYIDGLAFHWYGGDDRLVDGTYGYEALNFTHHYAPDKILLNTEGCSCPGVQLDSWFRAERLAHDIIYDLNNFAQGWIDWNLLLDNKGGPNKLKNFCDASIITSKDFKSIHYQPKFYYFGHFSKFLVPGSHRVSSMVIGNYDWTAMNPNIQANIEVAMYYCERSVRQQWTIHPLDHTFMLRSRTTLYGNDNDSNELLCLAMGDMNRSYLKLARCDTAIVYPNSNIVLLTIEYDAMTRQLKDRKSQQCLSLAHDVTEPGALLVLTSCNTKTSEFMVNDVTGEVTVNTPGKVLNHLCLTAGWPFLSAVAAVTPTMQTVVTIMNEASIATNLALKDVNKNSAVGMNIPARSIMTFIY